MKIKLEIHSYDRLLAYEIAGVDNKLIVGTVVPILEGATIEYEGSEMLKATGIPEISQFILDLSHDVILGLFTNWLYDKLKNKNIEKITFNRKVVTEITEQGIRQVIEEEIRR